MYRPVDEDTGCLDHLRIRILKVCYSPYIDCRGLLTLQNPRCRIFAAIAVLENVYDKAMQPFGSSLEPDFFEEARTFKVKLYVDTVSDPSGSCTRTWKPIAEHCWQSGAFKLPRVPGITRITLTVEFADEFLLKIAGTWPLLTSF